MVALGTADADAQGFLDRLGRRVGQAAERAIGNKAEQATEAAIDAVTDPDTYKGDSTDPQQQQGQQTQQQQQGNAPTGVPADAGGQAPAAQTPQGQSLEMTYAKSDFVAGDEIIFEDLLVGEQLGEFPSMWDLKSGSAEVASVGGENAIHMEVDTRILPLMKEENYLPDEFTIEFDLFVQKGLSNNSRYNIDLVSADGTTTFQISFYMTSSSPRLDWGWKNGGEQSSGQVSDFPFIFGDFNHFAISFNKRALKAYINGPRIVNLPRVDAPARFQIYSYAGLVDDPRFLKNVRIAKGAVPLYDRMMSDGKFITYGITFDVGKSTIKPESMGEINRIVQLMTENPDLKFSVEGHTDSTVAVEKKKPLQDIEFRFLAHVEAIK